MIGIVVSSASSTQSVGQTAHETGHVRDCCVFRSAGDLPQQHPTGLAAPAGFPAIGCEETCHHRHWSVVFASLSVFLCLNMF